MKRAVTNATGSCCVLSSETNLPLDTNLLLDLVDLCVDLGGLILRCQAVRKRSYITSRCSILTFAVILIKGDNLIYSFLGGISTSLRLFNLLRVTAFVNNEVENVEHFDGSVEECTLCGLRRE
jgi:hypothetical protein